MAPQALVVYAMDDVIPALQLHVRPGPNADCTTIGCDCDPAPIDAGPPAIFQDALPGDSPK
jgi:hypothetical protein